MGAKERDLEWWAGGKNILFGRVGVRLDCDEQAIENGRWAWGGPTRLD